MTNTNTRLRQALVLALVGLLACSLVVPGALAQAEATGIEYGDERAELEVYQPSWIDSDVTVDRTDDRTIYEVEGDQFEVQLLDVDHEHVERVSVVDGAASVEYDEDRDLYVVDPDGEGTIAIQWVVAEPVLDEEGNETDSTETTRYAASLQVTNTEWTHLTDDAYAETQQDAANWSAVEDEAASVAPSWSTDRVLSVGFAAVQFIESPTAALSADIQATLIMMTMRPGGLLILGTFLGLIAITAAQGFRWRHRFQKQLEDHDRVSQEKREAWLNKTRSVLQQHDWPDIFPDHIAQTMHDLWGPNVWQGFKNYQLMRSPTHTKGLWLQMMSQLGYSAVVHYDGDGEITEAHALTHEEIEERYGGFDIGGDTDTAEDDWESGLLDVDNLDEDDRRTDGGVVETERLERVDFEQLRFDHAEHRAIIDAIPADELDERVFLPSVEIDPEPLSLPIDNHNIDDAELVQLLNPDIPGDFESYEQMAQVHGEFLQAVVNHPYYTDEDGDVREEMDLLSFMSEMDSVLADKAEFASADVQRSMNFWIAEQLDADDKVEHTLADAYEHGVGRSDGDRDDVIGPDDVDLGGTPSGGV